MLYHTGSPIISADSPAFDNCINKDFCSTNYQNVRSDASKPL